MSEDTELTKISAIHGYEFIDSRGFPTVGVTVELQSGVTGTALVPSGASTGEHEAHELRDAEEKRFAGKGVLQAVRNVETEISTHLIGQDVCEQSEIDSILCKLDGTPNKSRLGANAILGVSLAAAHAAANARGQALFNWLSAGEGTLLPTPLVNVINGGAHAANSLDFQEFMLVPHLPGSFSHNIRAAAEIFQTLKKALLKDGHNVGLGDEGGFAPNLKSVQEALQYLMDAIGAAGYKPGEEVSLALDVAASEFYDRESGNYILKKSSGDTLSSSDLISLYEDLANKFPIVSIEDGLDENDWQGWSELTVRLGGKLQLVGDDLFVTNSQRLRTGIEKQAANAILIKLNQIGTLSETIKTVKLAQKHGLNCVISHRSGETEDTTIADLAVALEAGQIKTGSVCRSERTAKYNRLLWIEKQLGDRAVIKNPFL